MRIVPFLANSGATFPEISQAAESQPQGIPTQGPSTAQSSSYFPAPEWLGYLAQVRQQPQIRDDVLAVVAQRIANGAYDTSSAAAQTAAAILAAPE
jgi:hypothetical protein